MRDVDVFLFDEPLSNLDAKLRAELRVEIKRLHHRLKNTMIYVTHDQIEALTLADRIAIMRNGIIQQLDTPNEIYNRPVNLYVAGFMGSPGMNFMEGELSHHSEAALNFGSTKVPLGRYPFASDERPGEAIFGIRPEHVSCGAAASDEPFSADVEIEVVEPMGADTLVWAVLDGKEFRFRVDGQSELRAGQTTRIGFDPAKASIFDAQTELRL